MRQRLLTSVVILLIFAVSFWGRWQSRSTPTIAPPQSSPQHIVSLSPGITETLFALGAGQQCVGVTDYCTFPPEAAELSKLGSGLQDLNLELMIKLNPDLIIGRTENEQPGLKRLSCPQLIVSHKSFNGLVSSFSQIGNAVGKPDAGKELTDDFQARVARIAAVTENRPRPRLLLCIHRPYDTGDIRKVTTPSRGLLPEIVELAGGVNACRNSVARFPVLSAEGVLLTDPDVIVELVPPDLLVNHSTSELLADWNSLPELSAVKQRRLAIIDDDFAMIPGPRFILLIEKLARILHPEAPWDERN